MEMFLRDLESGEIHLRDRLQFELKSEYIPESESGGNEYSQEFYIFIPNSLQVNSHTYSKKEFYRDQSNFIRFKTPVFTLPEIIDPKNTGSPMYRIFAFKQDMMKPESVKVIEDEIKLLANIVRSSLRRSVLSLAVKAQQEFSNEVHSGFTQEAQELLTNLENFRVHLSELREFIMTESHDITLKRHFVYVEEFISNSISYYLTGIIRLIRENKIPNLQEVDQAISNELQKEKDLRKGMFQEPEELENNSEQSEFTFYRAGLLNKYILDALLLDMTRSTPEGTIRNIIGSFAAGIAMLIYLSLFIWQGQMFILNSEPFILATVILYILKDRLKESLKTISYEKTFKWFSDYRTIIKSPDQKKSLGVLKETVSFTDPSRIPEEIISVRNKEFHYILEDFPRPESVIHYKKKVLLEKPPRKLRARRHSLNMIFRFNIHQFLTKADNPYQTYWSIDPETSKLMPLRLPKVYHINIIMKNTYTDKSGVRNSEIKKFRLIIDKNGIKRVERVT